HLEFVLRGHGRLQHHAIKKQKPPTWRGFVSNLNRQFSCWRFFYMRAACAGATNARKNGGAHLDFACISTICGSVLQ
ncbi:hypothetical protein, partial [Burkholderia pseudomallei]